ncbi:ankyrin repeat-containing protein [Cavenderia fasciculata]|uniref:Ankyrin repeat-containing protein n=1 Tax=Cavenderia fasciculata TaxID=261658 RepID=F4PXK2_CACFS|nr:ankyrin repeat-containing protein [Cavenderia fasciculata]EGG19512.1 ankyrin repeat-containing protein [Cavenderia fasciculata]|eukprot:XP_004357806.1 ankyrin repeat-containing protein [Cavenderia fasciculata]
MFYHILSSGNKQQQQQQQQQQDQEQQQQPTAVVKPKPQLQITQHHYNLSSINKDKEKEKEKDKDKEKDSISSSSTTTTTTTNNQNNQNNNTSSSSSSTATSPTITSLNTFNTTSTTTTTTAPTSSTASSLDRKSWMTEAFSRRSSTSLPTTPMSRPLNKLHQAIAAKDLTKVKQRLAQPRKAKLEMLELDHMDQNPLCAALRFGCYDIVKDILQFYQTNKLDINQQDKNGYTALHVATSNCDDQILMLLLREEGVNVNLINDDKNSALHYFCQKFKSPNLSEPFELFLKKGVNINLQNKNGETPLHKSIFNNSVRLLMVNKLLEHKAEVNVLNSRGESPLHFAVRLGREDLVSVLVKAGADPNIKGNEKKTCYELSLQGQNVKVINFLKNVQDVYNWLQSIELGEYWLNFVKEEIFMDLLPDLDDTTLDSLKIVTKGHRIQITKQCRLLKEQQLQPTPTKLPKPVTPKGDKSTPPGGSFEKESIQSDELRTTLVNIHNGSNIIYSNDLEYTLLQSRFSVPCDEHGQMTLGIQQLHNNQPQIVHRDFKSLNLLVNEDWECKVCDFGLSRFNTADNLDTLSKIRGTFAYCSPEVANGSGSPYTTKSDIFSIGIVFWELLVRVLTGEYSRPYSEYPHIKMDFQIMLNSKEGLRPTLPSSCPAGLVNLYKDCVHQEASHRPTCEDIISSLNILKKEYVAHRQSWDTLLKQQYIHSNNNNSANTTFSSSNSSTSTTPNSLNIFNNNSNHSNDHK